MEGAACSFRPGGEAGLRSRGAVTGGAGRVEPKGIARLEAPVPFPPSPACEHIAVPGWRQRRPRRFASFFPYHSEEPQTSAVNASISSSLRRLRSESASPADMAACMEPMVCSQDGRAASPRRPKEIPVAGSFTRVAIALTYDDLINYLPCKSLMRPIARTQTPCLFGGVFTMCRLYAFPNMPHMRNIS